MLEQEPLEKRIIEQCLRERREFPDKIKNAPSLLLGLELFFRAWLELGSCRLSVMEEGPIPWLAISQYAKDYDIVGELYEDLVYYVRVLDNAYLKFKRSKSEKAKLSTGKGSQGGKKRLGKF
jgi:hypothetical protein